ncbi:MAG: hypothetical protein ACK5JH_02835 [Anaerocolumna sp.]
MEEFSNNKENLRAHGIKYAYRIVHLNANRNRRGLGSFGTNSKFDRQYYIFVQKKEYERATTVLNRRNK